MEKWKEDLIDTIMAIVDENFIVTTKEKEVNEEEVIEEEVIEDTIEEELSDVELKKWFEKSNSDDDFKDYPYMVCPHCKDGICWDLAYDMVSGSLSPQVDEEDNCVLRSTQCSCSNDRFIDKNWLVTWDIDNRKCISVDEENW
jgi:hypothetical protein